MVCVGNSGLQSFCNQIRNLFGVIGQTVQIETPAATQEQNKENCIPVVAPCGVLEMEQPAGEKKRERIDRSTGRPRKPTNATLLSLRR